MADDHAEIAVYGYFFQRYSQSKSSSHVQITRGVKLMLNIAVIGLGDVSKVHLSAIQENPHAKLVAVCDIDEAKNTITEATFYTNYKEMLAKEDLDCVHICLPHHLHYTVTKACVEKGVHVFQE